MVAWRVMEDLFAIQATDLHAAYGATEVLHGITLQLKWGEIAAISGPNGAGKSSLLEVLAGVRELTSGVLTQSGTAALVVQRPAVPATLPLTAADVVRIGAARPGRRSWPGRQRRNRRDIAAATIEALAAVELSACAMRPYAALSGGQRQRVLVAQGLATGAQILLLDEPAAGLDAGSRGRLRTILAAEAARGTAIVCVTHDQADLAEADRVIWLESGRIPARSGDVDD
ncbi:zinc/manganese transport system ATP-binding protein [Leucobacter luti]|uniref:Zinc/manganese transport system ATP-binding protein n=2 Tax=Leucobacter luti TaxID=340320 RepID=A0A4R6RXR0_9MICO|nr:zinc/manganese transport system ATP-binding protein [Leucobacter luti]